MQDLLKSVDTWFLVFLVIVLSGLVSALIGYFIFSMKQLFANLMKTIDELKDLIKELFEDRNGHAERIKALEIENAERAKLCDERHKERSGVVDRRKSNQ